MRALRNALLLALPLLAALAAAPARADIGPSVDARLENLSAPIVPGTPLSFDVVVLAGEPAQLESFTFPGGRWENVTADFPAGPVSIVPGTPLRFHVEATPLTEEPFVLGFLANGRNVTCRFDLTRRHFDLMHRANGVTAVPGVEIASPPADSAALLSPEAAPVGARPAGAQPVRELDPAAIGSAESHVVVVKGRFVYQRDDNAWVGADGVTVRVYDEDWGFDEHLGTTITGPDGSFAIAVTCSEAKPDLYCELETTNGAVTVEDGTWGNNYEWTTHIETDFAGSTLDYGSFSIADPSLRQALHMCTNVVRAWRYWKFKTGLTVSHVYVKWPDGSWPHYQWFNTAILIPDPIDGKDFAWKTETNIHEYGHHVMENFMWTQDPDYANGVCDDGPGGNGHCYWCEETDAVAVTEGWSYWFADVVTRTYAADYGLACNHLWNEEKLTGACMDSKKQPCNCDPWKTEGYFGALLRDLEDDSPGEVDPNGISGGMDQMAMGPVGVINAMMFHQVTSPADLLTALKLARPIGEKGELWKTALNAGYQPFDNTPPQPPGNLHSTDHAVGVLSGDVTLTMVWDTAEDDFSGAQGYAIAVTANGDDPGHTLSSTVNYMKSGVLAPGSYYVTVRTIDNAGNWSPGFATAGPYLIRAPYPADFGPGHPAGWDNDIVLRGDRSATEQVATTAGVLVHDAKSYLSVSGLNHGESASEYTDLASILMDGQQVNSAWTSAGLAPGAFAIDANVDSLLVRGGRHTIEVVQDGAEFMAEPDETDNDYGRQLVWTPLELPQDASLQRAAPPVKDAGWQSFSVPIGWKKFFNCDGLTYTHQINPRSPAMYGWCAVTAFAALPGDDADLYLHPHSGGSEDGFTDGVAWSVRGLGQLDALFTNRWAQAIDRMDVGVVNYNKGTGPYVARFVTPVNAVVGDSLTVAFADKVMLALVDLHALAADNGKIAVEVKCDPAQGPLYSLWFDPSVAYAGMADYTGKVGTDSTGHSVLTVTSSLDSHHGLAFYRNPVNGTAPMTFTVRIYHKSGDAKPVTPAGWHAALTPRAAADGSAASVPAPGSLLGDLQATWFNVAVGNASDVAMGSVYAQLSLDETVLGGPWLFNIAPGGTGLANNTLPTTVPGGRHVLSMTLDPNHVVQQLSRENDTFAEQWAWIPAPQSLGVPQWRKGTNGGKTAGWALVDPAQELDYDCDGLRTPAFGPTQRFAWAGVAVTPRPGSDVDVRLHAPTSVASGGFAEPLETSNWGPGLTDYVLIHFPAAPYQPFDVGIVRSSDDTSSYVSQVVGAYPHIETSGLLGPYELGPDRVVELHQFDLPAGDYTVRLVNDAGSDVDWGLAVHGGDRPYQNRLAGLDLDARWANGPGVDEQVHFLAFAPGSYCIAVWKNGGEDVAKTGTYRLQLTAGDLADAPGTQLPVRARLAGAAPNPFRPATDLTFELPRAGDARLEVFDIRGARVKTLAAGSLEAGVHHARWDGSDEQGRAVPGGVYMVRLLTPGASDVLRVVRLR